MDHQDQIPTDNSSAPTLSKSQVIYGAALAVITAGSLWVIGRKLRGDASSFEPEIAPVA